MCVEGEREVKDEFKDLGLILRWGMLWGEQILNASRKRLVLVVFPLRCLLDTKVCVCAQSFQSSPTL